MFIVYLHQISKMDRARKRDVRDGREMVARKQRERKEII